MGRKKQGLLAGIRQHNAKAFDFYKGRLSMGGKDMGPVTITSTRIDSAELTLETMQKAWDALPKMEPGPMVAVQGAGIMPLADAVAKFGDRLVECKTIDELLAFQVAQQMVRDASPHYTVIAQRTPHDYMRESIFDPRPLDVVTMADLQATWAARLGDQFPPMVTFSMRICESCGGIDGAHKPITSPEGQTINCPVAEAALNQPPKD